VIVNEVKASETLVLRQAVLRPGFKVEACYFPGDEDKSTHHLGGFINDNLSGVVSIYKRSNEDVTHGVGYQIRAMATCESIRGKGVGLKLLVAAEQMIGHLKADYIWANARSSAIGFYVKAGYKVLGDEFHIDGVGPHFVVYKTDTIFKSY